MVGKLLSLDLKDQGIAVGIVHVRISQCSRRQGLVVLIFMTAWVHEDRDDGKRRVR